jgi:hypothetical protein
LISLSATHTYSTVCITFAKMVSTYICILTKPTRKLYLLRDIVFICSLTFRILILALQLDYLLTLKVKPHKSVGFLLSILRTPPPPTEAPVSHPEYFCIVYKSRHCHVDIPSRDLCTLMKFQGKFLSSSPVQSHHRLKIPLIFSI